MLKVDMQGSSGSGDKLGATLADIHKVAISLDKVAISLDKVAISLDKIEVGLT